MEFENIMPALPRTHVSCACAAIIANSMDKPLKQRLVGALVLIALGVIFIPMLLRGPADESLFREGERMPPLPETAFAPGLDEAPEPVAPPSPEPMPTPDVATLDTAESPPTTEPVAPVTPAPDKDAPPAPPAEPPSPQASAPAQPGLSSWAVQVGSFAQEKNALALRDRLRKKGFPAFVERQDGKRGAGFRVRVGPELDRKKAEQWRTRLAKELGSNPLVTPYP
jgi:DedD protein